MRPLMSPRNRRAARIVSKGFVNYPSAAPLLDNGTVIRYEPGDSLAQRLRASAAKSQCGLRICAEVEIAGDCASADESRLVSKRRRISQRDAPGD